MPNYLGYALLAALIAVILCLAGPYLWGLYQNRPPKNGKPKIAADPLGGKFKKARKDAEEDIKAGGNSQRKPVKPINLPGKTGTGG